MKKAICMLLLFCLVLGLLPPAKAAQTATFTAHALKTSQTDAFRYWLYTPADPTPNMPLIVYLHGGSGKGDDLSLITGVEGFPAYLQRGELAPRAYVVIPQLTSDRKGWPDAGASILALVDHAVSAYNLDATNVSLTGHSMGGTGTWSLALSYPGTFARIAPLSGSVRSTDINLRKLKNMPIRAYVGDADTIVEPEASITFVEALQAQGCDAEITVLPGATHFDVPAAVYLSKENGLLDWLIDAKFSVDGVGCATWQDALTQTGEIKLLAAAQADGTLTGDISLDLNGHDLTGSLNAGSYHIFLRDSQTDDFTVADNVYGRYLCDAPAQRQPGYVLLENSVHRVQQRVEIATFRPAAAGIYFRCSFRADEVVCSQIESYGVALGAGKLPDFAPDTYSIFTDTAPFGDNSLQNGTLLKGIFKTENSLAKNRRNGEIQLYGQTYIRLLDGTLLQGEPVSMSLRQVLANIGDLNETQQQEMTAFRETFRDVLTGWEQ